MSNLAPLQFLEAMKLLASVAGDATQRMKLCMSGTSQQIEIFLRAEAARRGIVLAVDGLAFGVLKQHLLGAAPTDAREVYVCCPWDLFDPLDWRRGVQADLADFDESLAHAEQTAVRIAARRPAGFFYIDAPLPPTRLNHVENPALRDALRKAVRRAGATVLDERFFSLAAYLSNGNPFASDTIGIVAQIVLSNTLGPKPDTKKVLVTDLDDTLWAGLVAEDGAAALQQQPEGRGFKHFVYQTYLKNLTKAGVVLAAVSRNDPATVEAAMAANKAVVGKDDFVAVVASYQPKSAQIRNLAEAFNLSLDHFVFVDDSIVELAEVSQAVPAVACLRFPADEAGLPGFLDSLNAFFSRREITQEDLNRTRLYGNRQQFLKAAKAAPGDLTGFLRGLGMELAVHDRTKQKATRAVQLINKTNQFNLNGVRVDAEQLAAQLAQGWRLFSGSLSDAYGDHGEVVVLLLDPQNVVRSFVMSCRVFQRQVEYAFVAWIANLVGVDLLFDYRKTSKNEAARMFFGDRIADGVEQDLVCVTRKQMADICKPWDGIVAVRQGEGFDG